MEKLTLWQELVVNPITKTLNEIIGFTPNIISSLFVIIIGWILALLAKVLLQSFLKSIGFDHFSQKIQLFPQDMEKDGKKILPHQFAATVVYWIVLFSVFIMAFNRLRLRMVSFQLETLVSYTVTVISVTAIVLLGLFVSMLVYRIIRAMAQTVGFSNAEGLATFSKWAVLFFTLMLCFFHVGVPRDAVLMVLGVTYLTLCITFIIAFGIGGAGFASSVLAKLVKDKDSPQS